MISNSISRETHHAVLSSRSGHPRTGTPPSQIQEISLAQFQPTKIGIRVRHALVKFKGCLRHVDVGNPVSLIVNRTQRRDAYNKRYDNIAPYRRPPQLYAEHQSTWIRQLKYFAKNNHGQSTKSLIRGMAYAIQHTDYAAFKALWRETSADSLLFALQQDCDNEFLNKIILPLADQSDGNEKLLPEVIARIPNNLLSSKLTLGTDAIVSVLNSLTPKKHHDTLNRIIPLIPQATLENYASADQNWVPNSRRQGSPRSLSRFFDRLNTSTPSGKQALDQLMARLRPFLKSEPDYVDRLFQYGVSRKWQPNTVAALIEAGAQIDARNENGETALIIAAKTKADHTNSGYNNVLVQTLLDYGASPELTDNQGRSVLDYARDDAWIVWDHEIMYVEREWRYQGHPSAQAHLQAHFDGLEEIKTQLFGPQKAGEKYYDFMPHHTGEKVPSIKGIMKSSLFESIKDVGAWKDIRVRMLLNSDGRLDGIVNRAGIPRLGTRPVSDPNSHALDATLSPEHLAKIADFLDLYQTVE